MFKLLAKHSLNNFAITAEQLDSNCSVPQSSLTTWSDNICTRAARAARRPNLPRNLTDAHHVINTPSNGARSFCRVRTAKQLDSPPRALTTRTKNLQFPAYGRRRSRRRTCRSQTGPTGSNVPRSRRRPSFFSPSKQHCLCVQRAWDQQTCDLHTPSCIGITRRINCVRQSPRVF